MSTHQCFVVGDLQRVIDAVAELPAAISGRVSFLRLRADAPPVTGDDLPDGILRASDLVLCDGTDLTDLPAQLLGDTLIVGDLATARALAAEYPGHRFVTRQGELLDTNGVLTVGIYHAEAGILALRTPLNRATRRDGTRVVPSLL